MRHFPSHIEQLAKRAYETVVTDERWAVLGEATKTASAAVLVEMESSGARAFAKPANPTSWKPPVAAAHEKIVSDLAYRLNLPVPPVMLARPEPNLGFPPIVALSFVPFPQCRRWSERGGIADFAPANIHQVASAMATFHTLICDSDHGGNDGNQVIDMFLEERFVHGIAFIDYAYSLTHNWDWNQIPPVPNLAAGKCPPFDGTFTSLDEVAVAEAVKLIESLADEDIAMIVGRIPDEALEEGTRSVLVSFLCERKRELRRLMGA